VLDEAHETASRLRLTAQLGSGFLEKHALAGPQPSPSMGLSAAVVPLAESAATKPYIGPSSICEVGLSGADPAADESAAGVQPLTLAAYTRAYDQWVAQQLPDASQEPEDRGQGHRPTARCSNLDKQAEEWRSKVHVVARARGVVPEKVLHDRPCSGLCAQRCPAASYSMFLKVKKALSEEAPTAQQAPLQCCMAFRTDRGGGRSRSWTFGLLHRCIANGTAGLPSTQAWLHLEPLHAEADSWPLGADLRFARCPHVAPEGQPMRGSRRFINGITTGRLQVAVGRDFVAAVVARGGPAAAGCSLRAGPHPLGNKAAGAREAPDAIHV